MAEQYFYAPLDLSTDSIRLLRLCKGYPGAEISCELFETFLSESEGVPYEALSYTWGGERTNDSPHVILDGQRVTVTSNLFEALCSLRLEDTDRYLWIDALCINQDDHREKGHQVGQMRYVYQYADRVLVWLGQGSDDIDDLMDMMAVWGKELGVMSQKLPVLVASWSARVTQLDGDRTSVYQGRVSTFARLIKHPWFRRVWIIQEVANARVVLIKCGSRSISSRIFSTFIHLMDLKPHPHTRAVLEVMPGPLQKLSWWNDDRRLSTLLIKFNGSEATKEHDRIYALLGIASDAPEFPIDYGCPFQQVINRTVSFLVLGSVDQSRLLNRNSSILFDELFQGVTNTGELNLRIFELALRHSKQAFLNRLIHTSAIATVVTDVISNYKWDRSLDPKYSLNVFLLCTGVDVRNKYNKYTLEQLFECALQFRHRTICDYISEMAEFSPSDEKLIEYLPRIPDSAFGNIVRREFAGKPLTLYHMLVFFGRHYSHRHYMQFLLDQDVCGVVIFDDKWIHRAFIDGVNALVIAILEKRKAVGAEGLHALVTDLMFSVIYEIGDLAIDLDMLSTLIDYGANIEAHSPRFGWTPLRHVIFHRSYSAVLVLAERGADLNSRGENGGTPLHLAEKMSIKAERSSSCRIIALLLLKGADELAVDSNGRTPWQLNKRRNPLGTKRRSKKQMQELLRLAKVADKWLTADLLKVREGDDTEDHPDEVVNPFHTHNEYEYAGERKNG